MNEEVAMILSHDGAWFLTRVYGMVRASFLGRVGTVDASHECCDSHGIGF
jgi:hypothetical protein